MIISTKAGFFVDPENLNDVRDNQALLSERFGAEGRSHAELLTMHSVSFRTSVFWDMLGLC